MAVEGMPLLGGIIRIPLRVRTLMRLARSLRAQLRAIGPHAVLSFLTQTNIVTILATRGLGVRTIVSERNDPRRQRHSPRVEWMRRRVYRFADVVTANSAGALTALEAFVPKRKLALLPNPIGLPASNATAKFPSPTFVCVARLVEQKGLNVLLEASSRALQELPGWRLAVIGDGPLRQELKALASQLGIAGRVDWLGHLDDPFPYMRAAQFFVLTSHFEGTPNALLEAMSCGLPAIVTDASPGPVELVGHQEAGLVVPAGDAVATAAAILQLARNPNLQASLSRRAVARVRVHQPAVALKVWRELMACV